jgi:hypothetical protein
VADVRGICPYGRYRAIAPLLLVFVGQVRLGLSAAAHDHLLDGSSWVRAATSWSPPFMVPIWLRAGSRAGGRRAGGRRAGGNLVAGGLVDHGCPASWPRGRA